MGKSVKLTDDPNLRAIGGSSSGGIFTDLSGARIDRIEHATGTIGAFTDHSGGVRGLAFGADGRLYAGQPRNKRIVAYAPDGKEEVIAEGIEADHLVVGARGGIWCTEPRHRRVWYVDPRGGKRVVHEGLESPSGLALSPDQAFLAVADAADPWVWSFQVGAAGSLLHGQPFYASRRRTSPRPPCRRA